MSPDTDPGSKTFQTPLFQTISAIFPTTSAAVLHWKQAVNEQATKMGQPPPYPEIPHPLLPTPPSPIPTPPSPPKPPRFKLPDTRPAITRKNAVGPHEFYVTVGFYEEGPTALLGEVFINMAKEGSTLGGMCDMIATTISLALQYGVPWESLYNKYFHMRFEPSGRDLHNEKDYRSLAHAIADTVQGILDHRKSLWGE